MRIFTWHIHGSYLYYLSLGNFTIYIPVNEFKNEGYYGRGETFPFGRNVVEVPVNKVKELEFDCILFQTNQNYLIDQYEILSAHQRTVPKIYLEHDPPTDNPVNTRHIVKGADITLVHVTHFNKLMWDHDNIPVRVIEHGVEMPDVQYSGEIEKGVVVINNLPTRGRLLGLDLFLEVRKHIPLDLVGMGTGDLGLGEVLHPHLPEFISRYRFFFNPIRYTSLGLAICEAMVQGLPVVGLATTELSTVIDNNVYGFIHTDIHYLIEKMQLMLNDHELAKKIGSQGKKTAMERFNIKRFVSEWESLFDEVTRNRSRSKFFSENTMHLENFQLIKERT
ncbi:MAG TPA: glycosyltransferase family 4 protein [Flavitalea sp.]|nr:glycosyltransferase family 4 protein [Flavitalea sp.]